MGDLGFFIVTKKEIKILDKLWSDKVKEPNRCACCHRSGKEWKMEAAHIVGRSYRATRWGVEIDGKYDLNGLCLCHVCHRGFDEHMEVEKVIRERVIGLERYFKLTQTKKVLAKYQDFDIIKKNIMGL